DYADPIHHLDKRGGLDASLLSLLDDLPRPLWVAHPNFDRSARLLLQIHRVLRGQAESLARAGELAVDGPAVPLWGPIRRGVEQLVDLAHAHHGIEDDYLYPSLVRLRPAIARPLALLGNDHQVLATAFATLEDAAQA